MQSKEMKNLVAELEAKTKEAKALNSKDDATEEEINAKLAEIKAIKAKIKTQEEMDDGKEFDANGDVVVDMKPVNEPIHAEPASHKGPFKNFGEQVVAIINSSRPGAVIDERLLKVQNASGANEGVPSEGGYLVQQDFISEIQKVMFAESSLLSMCRKIPISSNANSVKLNGVDETSRAY